MKNIGKADCELIKLLQTFALLCLLLFLLHRYESSAKHIKKAFFFLHRVFFLYFLAILLLTTMAILWFCCCLQSRASISLLSELVYLNALAQQKRRNGDGEEKEVGEKNG